MSSDKVGRNDRCPCGSGKKYKNCCQGKAGRMGPASWIGVVAIAAAAVFVAFFLFDLARGGSDTGADRTCPPGQFWSVEHGHCHQG